ncbi:hypothetical protein M441DRAFT_150306 [Trichoderma asperellum CBS 433.97]|uniref:IMS import disulfide relay-system CHCH-CHCH-like Cx9C domain-containing protein n=1 Tax=Trichoderma asperellum (strain ATCC 204424 / CBS 433.97 / NBRC 101777) TaxID=1042311 RepID=A0A2T3YVX3_TRIA4|nr:hypothetical protein M441DRAFT_150306 [Trichoderma asperellum CBS 433.97]PTB36677.1 hypothetical protein M441DRAFT_150306 [Trichoderma asperellum CBS 433.97]
MNPQTSRRPIQKLSTAVAKCAAEATAYGKCIVADYNDVTKDKCAREFLRLKDCYLVHLPFLSLYFLPPLTPRD